LPKKSTKRNIIKSITRNTLKKRRLRKAIRKSQAAALLPLPQAMMTMQQLLWENSRLLNHQPKQGSRWSRRNVHKWFAQNASFSQSSSYLSKEAKTSLSRLRPAMC
jgi:hypothetical protein